VIVVDIADIYLSVQTHVDGAAPIGYYGAIEVSSRQERLFCWIRG
jgi:hypothetical protein